MGTGEGSRRSAVPGAPWLGSFYYFLRPLPIGMDTSLAKGEHNVEYCGASTH